MYRFIVGFENLRRAESSIRLCPKANRLRLVDKEPSQARDTLVSSSLGRALKVFPEVSAVADKSLNSTSRIQSTTFLIEALATEITESLGSSTA